MALTQSEDPGKQIRELNKNLDSSKLHAAELDQIIASHEEALAWRARQVTELTHKLNIATIELEAIRSSSGWKFILQVRQMRDSLLPCGSARRELFEKIMGLVKGNK